MRACHAIAICIVVMPLLCTAPPRSQRDEGYSDRNGKFLGKEVFIFRKAGRLGRKGKGPPGWTPADANAVL